MVNWVIRMRYEVLSYENIRNLRIDHGYTQQQIAEYLNVRQNTYCQYELGILNYPIDVLCKLSVFYNVSVDYLLGLTEEKKPYPPQALVRLHPYTHKRAHAPLARVPFHYTFFSSFRSCS